MFREGEDDDFEHLENPPTAPIQQNQVQIKLKPGRNQIEPGKARYKSGLNQVEIQVEIRLNQVTRYKSG